MIDNCILFDARIAEKYSLEEAIVIHKIYGWIKHNAVNGKNYHNGRYWTFNSLSAFAKYFPFWSESKVKRILIDLYGGSDKKEIEPKHEQLLLKGNFNKSPFDRTVWYSFTDKFFMYLKELGYETYTDFPQNEIPFSADDPMDIPPADKQYQESNNTINNTNNNITSTNVDVPQSGGKEKKYTVTHRCRLIFEKEYLQKKGIEYYYAAKDATAVKQIVGKIRKYLPGNEKDNENAIVENFYAFVHLICTSGRVDQWILDNLSLPNINSKFNELYSQLKNGNQQRQQHQNARDDEQAFLDALERRYGSSQT